MAVCCAAVVGQLNNPLYIESFVEGGEEELNTFHYIIHCALDAVEEKVNAVRKVPGEIQDPYLGIIFPTQDYKVFGYVVNTRVKFFLIVDDGPVKDEEMRTVFKRLHTVYVDAASNPFYTANTALTSERFDASVRTIVTSLGAAA